MRKNENIKIIGQKVILIPYEEYHVEKYHQWMSSLELQELTASEPLTLAEEYEMQQTWRSDDNKCTFLILDLQLYEQTKNETASLIGDTNLFLSADDVTDEATNTNLECDQQLIGEAEIMIAEPTARKKGMGKESMLLMLKYGISLGLKKFIVKIGYDNIKSQTMFKKFQFNETSRTDIFREVTYERFIDSEWLMWLNNQVPFYKIDSYIK